MKLLDRALQRLLLQTLADAYPQVLLNKDVMALSDHQAVRVNLAYLEEHGLVQVSWYPGRSTPSAQARACITGKGLDFLAEDGGLSAILGVLVVKIHEDTLKEIVAAKIQSSDLPQPDKQRFLDQLRELPGESTKHLVLRLVDAGLENWQKALPLLQNMLHGS